MYGGWALAGCGAGVCTGAGLLGGSGLCCGCGGSTTSPLISSGKSIGCKRDA